MASKLEGGDLLGKTKMGRAPKQTLAEKLVAAQARDIIAKLDDDTLVDTEMAAIYLYMSVRQLEDLRAEGGGPDIEKTIQKDAQRQNQPVRYAMGELRRYRRSRTASSTFDAALKAGLAGWVSVQMPFFAEPKESGRRARDVLLRCAWDADEESSEELFASLARGSIRAIWLTAAEASASIWAEPKRHSDFAELGLRMLRDEIAAVGSAIERSDVRAAAREGSDDERPPQP